MSILTNLKDIKDLPTLPEVMVKVQALISSNKGDANALANIIKQDPSLTTIILKTANSAYYNIINRRISSVSEAIARIGFNEVLKITLAMSIIQQFSNTKSMIGYKAFWRHSLTAANVSLIIVDLIKHDTLKEYRKELFLAGLLHDIGILIYDQFFHEEFTKIIDYALSQEKTYLSSEGIISPKETHAFIGSALLEIWKLALPVVVAVRNHHSPEKAPEKLRELVAVISLVEYVLCNSRVGSFEGAIEHIDDSVWDITGLEPGKINMLNFKAEEEAVKTDAVLSIDSVYKKSVRQSGGLEFPLREI